ncbi:hypothetical protein PanWU01x14_111640, partial [Parasponia andersonii]
ERTIARSEKSTDRKHCSYRDTCVDGRMVGTFELETWQVMVRYRKRVQEAADKA